MESTSICILFQKEHIPAQLLTVVPHTFASQSVSHCLTKFSGTGGKPRPMMFNTHALGLGRSCHRQDTLATTFEGFKAALEHLNSKESMATTQTKTWLPKKIGPSTLKPTTLATLIKTVCTHKSGCFDVGLHVTQKFLQVLCLLRYCYLQVRLALPC